MMIFMAETLIESIVQRKVIPIQPCQNTKFTQCYVFEEIIEIQLIFAEDPRWKIRWNSECMNIGTED